MRGVVAAVAAVALLVAAAPVSQGRVQALGIDGVWGAKRDDGRESFGFSVRRNGRRIVNFVGGLSPASRERCYGTIAFERVRVSRRGRFKASRRGDSGRATFRLRGRFISRRRAIFYVRKIEHDSTPCDSGPVRFRARLSQATRG